MRTPHASFVILGLCLLSSAGLERPALAAGGLGVTVADMAALRQVPPIYRNVQVLGYYAAGDGGGGAFAWQPGSTSPDDCGTVIAPTNAISTRGRWVRSWSGAANLKWWGAVGDGGSHLLSAAIASHAIPSLSVVQAIAPAVKTTSWDSDAVAVELAKASVPQDGTCYVPAGTYICSTQSWDFGGRSHITWNGAGPSATKFRATYDSLQMNDLNIGAQFAPYDMAGWQMAAAQVYPQNDAKVVGTSTITLKAGVSSGGLHVGDVVFWQDGRSLFQQNFGEFNQVTAIKPSSTASGGAVITMRYPWNRDYTSPVAEFGGIVTGGPYTVPAVNSNVTMSVDFSDFGPPPTPGDAVSLGNDVYTYVGPAGPGQFVFTNAGRGNTGKSITAGTKVAGVCALIRSPLATTDISMTNLGIVGCWDAIQIANTVNLKFYNVDITMQRMADTPAGGLFFDGDGGREIDFTNCTFTAPAAWASQWGRSTSGVRYSGCTFNDVAMQYSEYVNDCDMDGCTMTIDGSNPLGPASAIDIGMTTGGITIDGCTINASHMTLGVFENADIQGFAYYHGPGVTISNSTIVATGCASVFSKYYGFGRRPTTIANNSVSGRFESLGWIGMTPDAKHPSLGGLTVAFTGNQVSADFDYLLTSAGGCDNLVFENNTVTKLGIYQGWPGGSVLWDAGTGPWPAKQQLWMLGNTFYGWTFDPNIYGLYNLYNPWGGGMDVSNTFMDTSHAGMSNFVLTLTDTGKYTTSMVAGPPAGH